MNKKRVARLEPGDKIWIRHRNVYCEVAENHKPDTDQERRDWHNYRRIFFKSNEGVLLPPLWLPSNTQYFVKG